MSVRKNTKIFVWKRLKKRMNQWKKMILLQLEKKKGKEKD